MEQCCHSKHNHFTSNVCPNLWSNAKKIEALEQELEIMQDKENEIKQLIAELKAEK
ncbi:hypothetical protein JW960_03415 [candidate division KSB1 bacterium]|nr:hypothetical protein [candidate division KSB1 bacterium]